ncbi:unnamed protein product [marine sediment metagenome]|uniref:Uncharacterized protein n=1 Tax=marine sediment metagenome TaxID=412755 RepID=X1U2T5_9ZZZZ
MDTNELIKKATEKLQETKKQFESDEKKLKQLIEKKGNLEADELIESKPEQIQKIKKLKKETIKKETPCFREIKILTRGKEKNLRRPR